MWFDTTTNQIIARPRSIVRGETTYPQDVFNKWTNDALKTIGIYPYTQTPVDTEFYILGELTFDVQADKVVGTYSLTEKPLDTLRDKLKSNAASIAKNMMESLTSKYSPSEMLLWTKLEDDCRQHQVNGSIGLALQAEVDYTQRNIGVIIEEVITKADFLKEWRAKIIGARQLHENNINALTTIEALKSYNVYDETTWPDWGQNS